MRLRVPPRARAYVVHDDGCSDSAAIVARTGVVVGRCALRSRYGGGPVGVSGGSPVVGSSRKARDVRYGELGEATDLAERQRAVRR